MKNIYEEAGGTHQRQGDYERLKLKAPTEREAEIGMETVQPTNCRSPE